MIEWPDMQAPGAEPYRGAFEVGPQIHVEYATWGPPPSKAPTIILLHEGLGCIVLWRDFPRALSETTGCGVFTYSRLGYGRSSAIAPPLPVTRMADEAAQILPRLITAIRPTSLIIVGHSDGGTIAAHYLADDPVDELCGAVLMSPHFFCEHSNIAAIRSTCAAYQDGDLRQRLGKYHAHVDGAFCGWAETWLDPAFADWDMRGELSSWRHPVLFMQGRDDPYGSPGQADAASLSQQAEIVWLDACAHSPHLEQSERTLELIRDFVTKNCKVASNGE